MTTLTVELPDDVAADLEAEAKSRDNGDTPATLLAELAASHVAGLRADDPPPEVVAEIRRRQETPLSECRPTTQAMDDLEATLRQRDAENHARRGDAA